MNQSTTYTFTDGLVQAIVNNLNAQPAAQTRGLLNVIEAECAQQDKERAQSQRDEERQAIETEVKAALKKEAQGADDDALLDESQAPVQQLPDIHASA